MTEFENSPEIGPEYPENHATFKSFLVFIPVINVSYRNCFVKNYIYTHINFV